jgi:hypothetical protein
MAPLNVGAFEITSARGLAAFMLYRISPPFDEIKSECRSAWGFGT